MNELMLHVERIVRPVRATAGRKLRMRRELLGHLEAALAEEHAAGGDEAAALERAKRRLGEPDALRRQLQAAVPLAERMLLGRIPAPAWYERWEKRAFGFGAARLTMMQASVVTAGTFAGLVGAMFLATPVLWGDRAALLRALAEHGPSYVWANVAAAVVSMVALAMCYKVVSTIVRGGQGQVRRAAAAGGAAVGLLLIWVCLIVNVVAGEPASVQEVTQGLLAGVLLIGALMLLAKTVARWQRPYREWMELEVAE